MKMAEFLCKSTGDFISASLQFRHRNARYCSFLLFVVFTLFLLLQYYYYQLFLYIFRYYTSAVTFISFVEFSLKEFLYLHVACNSSSTSSKERSPELLPAPNSFSSWLLLLQVTRTRWATSGIVLGGAGQQACHWHVSFPVVKGIPIIQIVVFYNCIDYLEMIIALESWSTIWNFRQSTLNTACESL